MFICKIASIYVSGYLGFIIPYANPKEWPNPIAIGGSGLVSTNGIPTRYFDTSFGYTPNDGLTNFWNPRNAELSVTSPVVRDFGTTSTLLIKDQTGSQRRPYNFSEAGNPYAKSSGTFPYVEIDRGLYNQYNSIIRNSNNNYHLLPIQIVDRINGIYGEFDGISFVTGAGLNPEDTITVGSETWLCVPNINLLSPNQWASFRQN